MPQVGGGFKQSVPAVKAIWNCPLWPCAHGEAESGHPCPYPIGDHGHGAGPLIGRWDYQASIPGRGDPPVIPSMWFSTEMQVTTPVPEWDGQPVRMAVEEEAEITADGEMRWMLRRQTELHLVR